MKKIGKLQINPERIIKNDELVILKGGTVESCTNCLCNCKFIIEAWWGCYCSAQEIINAIEEHCGYGSGDCTCGPSC